MFNQGPTFFRKRGKGLEYKEHAARKIGGRKEKMQKTFTPKMAVWRRKALDGTITKTYSIERPGINVQPLRLATMLRAARQATSEIPTCSFESGFFDFANPGTYAEDGYFSRVAFRAATRTWVDSEDFLGSLSGGGAGNATCPYLPLPGSMPTSQSSRFTGKMRQVVQLIAGQQEPIPFEFCWGKTHGIYIASNGSWWVIEVNIIEGIIARPLVYCEVLTEARKAELGLDMPGIPSPTQGGTPAYQLATAEELGQYASTFPFYMECGWAFSYNGHEAQNVMWSWPDAWKRSHRFKIAISESAGRPFDATVSIEETSYVWGDRFGAPKFPYYIPAGGISLFTFDLRPDPILSGAPPGDYSHPPWYVFYGKDQNTASVWYSDSPDVPADESVNEDIDPADHDTCSYSTHKTPNKPSVNVTAGVYDINYSGPRIYKPTGPIPSPIEEEASFIKTGTIYRYYSIKDGDWNIGGLAGSSSRYAFSSHYISYTEHISNGVWESANYSSMIIPFYDREQLFLFHKKKEETSGVITTQWRDGKGWGSTEVVRLFTGGAYGGCDHGPFYRQLACGQALPDLGQTSVFANISSAPYWTPDPITANMFTPGDACYGTPDAHDTRVYCFDFGPPVPRTACGNASQSFPTPDEIISQEMTLYAINPATNAFEEVKTWDEYDPLDPYTAIVEDISSGSQVMLSTPDVFSGKAFVSAEMNGFQGDEYHFFGSPETIYPLADLTAGLDRGWFGVPFF